MIWIFNYRVTSTANKEPIQSIIYEAFILYESAYISG